MFLTAAVALAWAGGCELVLGSLPPVAQISDAGGGGGSTAGSGGGGASASATMASSAQGTGGACCDCDGDHVLAQGPCGGTDCDDHDPGVFPGETTYHADANPDPAVGFDWDCSGKAERNPAFDKTVSCAGLAFPCPTAVGFLAATPPPCGQGAPWGGCKQAPPPGLTCVNDVMETSKVMTCR